MSLHLTRYGSGYPIVLFHGWGFDSEVWRPIVPFLEKDYQLLLVDLPGFGFSAMMDWERFKKELLSQLPPYFAVLGWSLGGLFATRLAIENPDRVQYLCNVASSPRFILDTDWPGVPRSVFEQFHQNLALDLTKALQDFVVLQSNKQLSEYKPKAMPSATALKSGLEILDSWDLRPGLEKLKPKAHYFFGRLDPITPPATMQAMQALYPHCGYSLCKKSAHMPFLSQPEFFINELRGFIPCNATSL